MLCGLLFEAFVPTLTLITKNSIPLSSSGPPNPQRWPFLRSFNSSKCHGQPSEMAHAHHFSAELLQYITSQQHHHPQRRMAPPLLASPTPMISVLVLQLHLTMIYLIWFLLWYPFLTQLLVIITHMYCTVVSCKQKYVKVQQQATCIKIFHSNDWYL